MKRRIQAVLDTLDHVVVTPDAMVMISLSKHSRPAEEMAAEFLSVLKIKKGVHLRHQVTVSRHVDTATGSELDLKIRGVLNHNARIVIQRIGEGDTHRVRGYEPSILWIDHLLPLDLVRLHMAQAGRHPHAEKDIKPFQGT